MVTTDGVGDGQRKSLLPPPQSSRTSPPRSPLEYFLFACSWIAHARRCCSSPSFFSLGYHRIIHTVPKRASHGAPYSLRTSKLFMRCLRGVLDLADRGRIRVWWLGIRSSGLASHKALFQLPRAFPLSSPLLLLSRPLAPNNRFRVDRRASGSATIHYSRRVPSSTLFFVYFPMICTSVY